MSSPALAAFVGAFAAPSVSALASLGVVATVILFGSVLAVLVALAVVVTTNRERDGFFGAAVIFFASLWPPLAALGSRAATLARAFILFVSANWQWLVGVAALALFGWFYPVYAPDVKRALLIPYTTVVVPLVYNVPIRLVLLFRGAFELFYVLVNEFVVRLPTTIVIGLFYDIRACTTATWTPLISELLSAGAELAPAIVTWAASPSLLLAAPDFAPFGASLGRAIGSLTLFAQCTCTSGGRTIAEPFFAAFADGYPSVPAPIECLSPTNHSAEPHVRIAYADEPPTVVVLSPVNDTFFSRVKQINVNISGRCLAIAQPTSLSYTLRSGVTVAATNRTCVLVGSTFDCADSLVLNWNASTALPSTLWSATIRLDDTATTCILDSVRLSFVECSGDLPARPVECLTTTDHSVEPTLAIPYSYEEPATIVLPPVNDTLFSRVKRVDVNISGWCSEHVAYPKPFSYVLNSGGNAVTTNRTCAIVQPGTFLCTKSFVFNWNASTAPTSTAWSITLRMDVPHGGCRVDRASVRFFECFDDLPAAAMPSEFTRAPVLRGVTPPFAQFINSTLNIPFTVTLDIARPIVLGIRARQRSDWTVSNVWEAATISINGTNRNLFRLVDGFVGTIDAIVQQYYVLLLDRLVPPDNAYRALVGATGPPPRLLSFFVPYVWWRADAVEWLVNLFGHAPTAFTTFNGHWRWRLDTVADRVRDAVSELCAIFNWLALLVRELGIIGGQLDVACGNAPSCAASALIGLLDLVCCLVEQLVDWLLAAFLTVYNALVGTIYTLITRAYCATKNCNGAAFAAFRSIFQNNGAYALFDYVDFQLGLRSNEISHALCPNRLCSLPACNDDTDCQGSASIGVAARCDPRWRRCIYEPFSCAAAAHSSLIVSFDVPSCTRETIVANRCEFGACSAGQCAVKKPPLYNETTLFACDCDCPANEYRLTTYRLVDAFDCFGRYAVQLGGANGAAVRCFIRNSVAFVAEILLYIVELVLKTGVVLEEPESADLSLAEVERALLSLGECIVAAVAQVTKRPIDSIDTLPRQFLDAFHEAISGLALAAVEFIEIALAIFRQVLVRLRRGGFPRIFSLFVFLSPALRTLAALIQLVGALLYLLNDVGIDALAGALVKLGRLVNELAGSVSEALARLIQAIFSCITDFWSAVFKIIGAFAALLTGNADTIACRNIPWTACWLYDLLDCVKLVMLFVYALINAFTANALEIIYCAVRYVACFFAPGGFPEVPELSKCVASNSTECAEVYYPCVFEEIFCIITLPFPVAGCDGHIPYTTCQNRGFLCFLTKVLHVLIIFVREVIRTVELGGVFTEWQKRFIQAVSAGYRPERSCCTAGDTVGYSQELVVVQLSLLPTISCNVVAYAGCWSLETEDYVESVVCGVLARNVTADVQQTLIAQAIASSPPTPVFSLADYSLGTVLETLDATLTDDGGSSLGYTLSCLNDVHSHLTDVDRYNEHWPPHFILDRPSTQALSVYERYKLATCLDYLDAGAAGHPMVKVHLAAAAVEPSPVAAFDPMHARWLAWPLVHTVGTSAVAMHHVAAQAQRTLAELGGTATLLADDRRRPLDESAAGAVLGEALADTVGTTLGRLFYIGQSSLASFARVQARARGEPMILDHVETKAFEIALAMQQLGSIGAQLVAPLRSADVHAGVAALLAGRFDGDSGAVPVRTVQHIERRPPPPSLQRRWPDFLATTPLDPDAISLATQSSADACSLRAAPWECCESQAVCTDCSAFDRLAYIVEAASQSIARYYATDYTTRFLPCSNRLLTTNFGLDESTCPAAYCALVECSVDRQCREANNRSSSVAPVCNANARRCVVQGDAQCADAPLGTACLVYGQECSLGVCSGQRCIAQQSFPCTCTCADTFVTPVKKIPFVSHYFSSLSLPCLFNVTCIVERLYPDGVPAPPPDTYNATFIAHKRAGHADNFDLIIIDALNALSSGLGDRIIVLLEETASRIANSIQLDAANRFLDAFVFCDYRDGWFCPLADDSPRDCCSDVCERRTRGTTLVNGLFWGVVAIGAPLTLIALLPCLALGQPVLVALWLIGIVPLTLHIAYGGGLLCYVAGFAAVIVPVYMAASLLIMAALRVVTACCGGGVGSTLTALVRLLLSTLLTLIGLAVFLPGLPVCLGMDVYSLATSLVPPCFGVDPVLVDRSLPGATSKCGVVTSSAAGFVPPHFINCVSRTDLLAPTRFADSLDSLFYLVNALAPALVDEWAANRTLTPDFLNDYAVAHTNAAHAAAEPYASACFVETFFPNALTGLAVLVLNLALAAGVYVLQLTIVGLLIFPLVMAGRAISVAMAARPMGGGGATT